MGLAVSQVRLLALTRRKADIELDIQVDSKRKQALTRKSTELSQTYYQKLQQAKIQYATSDGYENVNYNYVMGKSEGLVYNDDFLKQVLFGSGNIAQKTCNSMILTNNLGKVVVNDEIASLVTQTNALYSSETTERQTAEAIKAFIETNSNVEGFGTGKIDSIDSDVRTGLGPTLQKIDESFKNGKINVSSADIIVKLLKNGGYQDGGTLYRVKGTTDKYVTSAEKAKSINDLHDSDFVKLQDGYNYTILTETGAVADPDTYSCMYDKTSRSFIKGATKANMMYLGNIVTYFGPILSASLKNGTTSAVKITGVKHPNDPNVVLANQGSRQVSTAGLTATQRTQLLQDTAKKMLLTGDNQYCIIEEDGKTSYWQKINGSVSRVTNLNQIMTEVVNHDNYVKAQDTNLLQAGFQSGMYQLCMVDNIAKGRYHKNTTLDFFIQMSYVSEKLASSTREEITAWFNSEQAKISEQETYWDTEITNLSTELTSVNTEIDSVKTLKSNAIKSVFDWGGN